MQFFTMNSTGDPLTDSAQADQSLNTEETQNFLKPHFQPTEGAFDSPKSDFGCSILTIISRGLKGRCKSYPVKII